jgi:hypothetical protein
MYRPRCSAWLHPIPACTMVRTACEHPRLNTFCATALPLTLSFESGRMEHAAAHASHAAHSHGTRRHSSAPMLSLCCLARTLGARAQARGRGRGRGGARAQQLPACGGGRAAVADGRGRVGARAPPGRLQQRRPGPGAAPRGWGGCGRGRLLCDPNGHAGPAGARRRGPCVARVQRLAWTTEAFDRRCRQDAAMSLRPPCWVTSPKGCRLPRAGPNTRIDRTGWPGITAGIAGNAGTMVRLHSLTSGRLRAGVPVRPVCGGAGRPRGLHRAGLDRRYGQGARGRPPARAPPHYAALAVPLSML